MTWRPLHCACRVALRGFLLRADGVAVVWSVVRGRALLLSGTCADSLDSDGQDVLRSGFKKEVASNCKARVLPAKSGPQRGPLITSTTKTEGGASGKQHTVRCVHTVVNVKHRKVSRPRRAETMQKKNHVASPPSNFCRYARKRKLVVLGGSSPPRRPIEQ
jgi:hypothetical protein